jgi:tetratricopeptide (TPR) repeat protein
VAQWGREHDAATALVWLGRAALAERDAAAARELLPELARRAAPPLLVADLINLLIDAGFLADAERLTRPLLAADAPAEVLLAAARLHEQRGELAAARALLDTALATAAPPLRPRIHEVRAELETRAGNLHRAQLERAAAVELRP